MRWFPMKINRRLLANEMTDKEYCVYNNQACVSDSKYFSVLIS